MKKKTSQFMKYKLINAGAAIETEEPRSREKEIRKEDRKEFKSGYKKEHNKEFKKEYKKEYKKENRTDYKPEYKSEDRKENKEEKFTESKFRPSKKFSKKERFFDRGSKKEKHQKIKLNSQLSVIVHGEVQKNQRGFGFLLHKPEDIFIPPNLASPLVSGDHIKAWLNPKSKEIIKIEIVNRTLKSFIGTYETETGDRRVSFEEKGSRVEVRIKERPNIEGLKNGDKVLVEVIKYEPSIEGKIIKTFGQKLAPKLDTFAVVTRAQWPMEFSEIAMLEAKSLSEKIQKEALESGYKGRRDLREKPFVTIDGKDSRDFDDAILVEKTQAGYVLYVAIADVAEFVKFGSNLDEEAYSRSTSVYFPEWVIPMLPEALSNGACSLRPDEDKLTLTCEMHIDHEGKKRTAKIYESVIRSHRRCIYENVQEEFQSGNEFWKVPFELYKRIRIRRFKRGAMDLDLPEAKVILDENDDTIDIKKMERVDSHKLIEEFMIAANEAVTEIMERERWPFVYRVHEPPKEEALERFERFASALGLTVNIGEGKDPKLIARFVESSKNSPFSQSLHYLLLRSMKQARYEPVNLYHFGLASRAYTHFTSPIRRYPDLMVHRILKRYARREVFNSKEEEEYLNYLTDACEHCSKQERKAEELDRKVIKIKKARFMEKKLGQEFSARVTNVSEKGLFLELEKFFIEGMVSIEELGNDYYVYSEERMMLRGKRTGVKFKIGDLIYVSVLRVDIDQGLIDFSMVTEQED